jgi:hypothetical protein
MNPHLGQFDIPSQTQNAGTVITALIQPRSRGIARVNEIVYESAATAHDLVFMKSLGETYVTTAQAAADTTLVIAAKTFGAAQTLAANDYIAVQLASGNFQLLLASAVSTLTLTVGALSEAVTVGAKVHMFGVLGDTGHHTMSTKASTVNTYRCAPPGGLVHSGYNFVSSGTRYANKGFNKPIMFYSANGTNAGLLRSLCGTYNQY